MEQQDVVKDDSDRLSVLREALRERLGAERFELWLGRHAELSLQGDALVVRSASRAENEWLRRRLHGALKEACAVTLGAAGTIAYETAKPSATGGGGSSSDDDGSQRVQADVSLPLFNSPRSGSETRAAILDEVVPSVTASAAPAPPSVALADAEVSGVGNSPSTHVAQRPRWTFRDFAVGPSNALAVQAALEIAEHPGRYNPLLISGPPGCGKSHLLHAIADHARAVHGRLRAVRLTAEQFTTQFVEALDRRLLPSFRQKTRSADLLLIDDVHFLVGKKASFEELLYTIDALQQRGGQVVLASDRDASQLQAQTAELASRVSAGLAVVVAPPDYQTRLGILRGLCRRLELAVDETVLEFTSRQVVGSGRLLSGAVNRLVAASMARGKAITLELAEPELAEFCRQHAPQVRLGDIQRAVCEVFGVDTAQLKSSRKNRAVAEPRMLAMWLARRYTRAALSEIGDFFGRRSHSTVVSAQRKFERLIGCSGEIIVGDQPCQVEEAVRRVEAVLRTG